MRLYDHNVVRFNTLDPIAATFPMWSGYNYVVANPIRHIDPFGLDTTWHKNLPTVSVTAYRVRPKFQRLSNNDAEPDPLIGPFEHHYNGSLAAPSAFFEAYATMNQQPRGAYYQTVKAVNKTFGTTLNSATLFKGARTVSRSADKLLSKLGNIGMGITAANIVSEYQIDKVNAHTVVDIAFLGLGVLLATETIALSPAIVVGLGVYGLADWVIDFDDSIDSTFGFPSKSPVLTGADTHLLPLPDLPNYDHTHDYMPNR